LKFLCPFPKDLSNPLGDSSSPDRQELSQRFLQFLKGALLLTEIPKKFPKRSRRKKESKKERKKMSNKIVKEAHTASVVNLNKLVVSLGRE